MPIAWYLITERGQELVKALMPRRWHPPGRGLPPLEDVEEIGRLMRERPAHPEKVR